MEMTTDLKLVRGATDADEALLDMLRLDPTKIEAAVKVPISLQVRKPQKHDFVRVHPDIELPVFAIELKDDDAGFYLVAGNMAAQLSEEAAAYVLRPYVNRAGVLRLWPIRLPGADGKINRWHATAATAAAHAMKRWTRVTANRSAGEYEIFDAQNQPPDPDWPDLTLPDMLRLAFTDRGMVIQDAEHPVVRQLAGRL
jgi:hypothetical protein